VHDGASDLQRNLAKRGMRHAVFVKSTKNARKIDSESTLQTESID
jgi:hypothetical protein